MRRRGAMPKSKIHASAAPPPLYHGVPRPGSFVAAQELVELAMVAIVMADVPAFALVMLTGDVAPKLTVGGLIAPEGLLVTCAVKTTLPVNPAPGVTVIVDAFPVVAPAATDTALPVTVKDGFTPTGFTVTTTCLVTPL